jgi:hypothetical protein
MEKLTIVEVAPGSVSAIPGKRMIFTFPRDGEISKVGVFDNEGEWVWLPLAEPVQVDAGKKYGVVVAELGEAG